jgi:hypothetical protein
MKLGPAMIGTAIVVVAAYSPVIQSAMQADIRSKKRTKLLETYQALNPQADFKKPHAWFDFFEAEGFSIQYLPYSNIAKLNEMADRAVMIFVSNHKPIVPIKSFNFDVDSRTVQMSLDTDEVARKQTLALTHLAKRLTTDDFTKLRLTPSQKQDLLTISERFGNEVHTALQVFLNHPTSKSNTNLQLEIQPLKNKTIVSMDATEMWKYNTEVAEMDSP